MGKVLLKYIKFIVVTILVIIIGNIFTLIDITNKNIISTSYIPYSYAPNDTIPEEGWKNQDYWEWHTRTTTDDKAYNGTHIVMENDVIDFYGYSQISYKDFLYKNYENSGKKIFQFIIDESKANYHTLDGAGFIFNSNIVDNKLSGYVILFNEKEVCLYRLSNVDIAELETTPNRKISNYGELIKTVKKLNSDIHELTVEATPANIKVVEAEQEILNVNLDSSLHVGESFGLLSSYVQHSCPRLSKIEFSKLNIIIQDYEIYITDVNTSNIPISQGYFKLQDENGNIIREGYAGEDGRFNMNGLGEGNYTIVQTIAPPGYKLNDTPIKFTVTPEGKVTDNKGEEIKLIIQNEKEEQPEEPNEPTKPEQPEEPNEPTKPEQPEEPNEPTKPEQPEEPKEPIKPEQPEEPRNPSNNKESNKQKTNHVDNTTTSKSIPHTGITTITTTIMIIISLGGIIHSLVKLRKCK